MTKEKLLSILLDIYHECRNKNWDNHNSEAITEDTYKHGIRFINKLDKNQVSLNNVTLIPLTDNNLSFKWEYNDKSSFSIDFDRSNDTLIWCCYKDDQHIWSGSCIHFEDIVNNLKKYIQLHEKEK